MTDGFVILSDKHTYISEQPQPTHMAMPPRTAPASAPAPEPEAVEPPPPPPPPPTPVEEWQALFERSDFFETLRFEALAGKLRGCRFRCVCWMVCLGAGGGGERDRLTAATHTNIQLFLEVLSSDRDKWVAELQALRNTYSEIEAKVGMACRLIAVETASSVLHCRFTYSPRVLTRCSRTRALTPTSISASTTRSAKRTM